MADEGEAIDIITLQQRLSDKQQLEPVGGIPYLNALQDAVPSAANLEYYLDIVQQKFGMRRLIHTCTDIVGRVYDFEGEFPELLDRVETEVLNIGQVMEAVSDVASLRAAAGRAITAIETAWQNPGTLMGLATGFPDLDRMTNGMKPGNMIVVAGRPSTGKTSLAMNIAENVSVQQALPVGVFSLEMTTDELVMRLLCTMARLNLRRVQDGMMSEQDFASLRIAHDRLQGAPLYIDDTPGLSIMQLRARARRMAQQYGIRLFVIDYLQLLHSDTPRAKDNRVQEVSELSGGVKALAKELRVPVIVLSQLNREMEKNKRKPKLSDLRESGAIEQDADLAGLLYRPNDDDDEPSNQAEANAGYPVNLLIAKQRNGPTGDVPFTFLNHITRFEARSRIDDEDVPEGVRQPHNN